MFRIYILLIIAIIPVLKLTAFDIVIPAMTIPEVFIPAQNIPGKTIPAYNTPYGIIPEIVIDSVHIPAIIVPRVDTRTQIVNIPQFEKVMRITLDKYISASKNSNIAITLNADQIDIDKRVALFVRNFSFSDPMLMDLFINADIDKSGKLSLSELTIFQQNLTKNYKYIDNNIALRPDKFLALGGGDCEDWALLTAALCNFWGIDAYIACFFGNEEYGHAICVIKYENNIPFQHIFWQFKNLFTNEGHSIPDGIYIPIDYQFVGSVSSALSAGMKLKYLFIPSQMYGITI